MGHGDVTRRLSNLLAERIVHAPPTPSHASVRDHVRRVLEKLKSHQKEQTSTAEEGKKVHARDDNRKAAFAERLKAAMRLEFERNGATNRNCIGCGCNI